MNRVEFHPSVEKDLTDALQYYSSVSPRLADDFLSKLRQVIAIAATNPDRFHIIKKDLHRASLSRFPYHIIYRTIPQGIRVTLLRHHRRHPAFGLKRR